MNNKYYSTGDFLNDYTNQINMDNLKISITYNEHFFAEQKGIYNSF